MPRTRTSLILRFDDEPRIGLFFFVFRLVFVSIRVPSLRGLLYTGRSGCKSRSRGNLLLVVVVVFWLCLAPACVRSRVFVEFGLLLSD